MKFAAYTEEGIFGIGSSEAEARSDGEAAMRELEATPEELAQIQILQISDELVAALAAMDAGGPEVAFDVESGVLVLAEADEDEAAA
jgi:hypothetical protein